MKKFSDYLTAEEQKAATRANELADCTVFCCSSEKAYATDVLPLLCTIAVLRALVEEKDRALGATVTTGREHVCPEDIGCHLLGAINAGEGALALTEDEMWKRLSPEATRLGEEEK